MDNENEQTVPEKIELYCEKFNGECPICKYRGVDCFPKGWDTMIK